MAQLPILQPSDESSCNSFPGGLSHEQIAVAQEMRAIKDEGRRLKAELRAGQEPVEPRKQRLAELERRFRELDVEREEARKRKMIALGYSG